MEFSTPVVQKCYEKIAPMMNELFGEAFVHADKEFPVFWLTIGSAAVRVSVWSFGDDESTIQTYCAVVTGVENTPELMQYLLQENAGMRFGSYGIDEDGDVILQHTIIGDTCDKPELKASVLAIAFTADEKDDEIMAKFGGQRAADRNRD